MIYSNNAAYQKLKTRFAEIENLEGAASILNKDAQTFMPNGSGDDRSQQMQSLATVCHDRITDPKVAAWLDEAEANQGSLFKDDRRNLFLMRRLWIEKNSLSPELARERARVEIEGQGLHDKLKETGDWANMRDWLASAFDLARQAGEAKMKPLGLASPYEALLDGFSPGMRDETIAREFGRLEAVLPTLIRDVREKQAADPQPIPLQGPFPAVQQAELFRRLVKAVGFDFNRGRLDVSGSHPSSGGTPDDSRITTGFDEKDFLRYLFAAVHEAGHAAYNQNRPKEWRYQPAGSHLGTSIHESQSRIIEVQACHTSEFFKFLEGQAREVFNRLDDPALSAENLERLANRVNPSFIRTAADEVTYPAHVILRYTIEKGVIEGRLSIDDLPQAWTDGMKRLLGITPPYPSKGHMQDVHWPAGEVGYFPAYTIGDIGAAQLFAAACKARPGLRSELANGNFMPLHEWLNENVRRKGALMTPEELFRSATGEDLNARYYLDHLSQRYLGKPLETPQQRLGKRVAAAVAPLAPTAH